MLLRDADNQTWRIESSDIEDRQRQGRSLMPVGLLKDSSPEDLADLNAYLKGL